MSSCFEKVRDVLSSSRPLKREEAEVLLSAPRSGHLARKRCNRRDLRPGTPERRPPIRGGAREGRERTPNCRY